MDKIGRLRALEKLDEAFEAEIRRVSTVQYNSNEICRHFFGQLRAKYEALIAELGQEVGAVTNEMVLAAADAFLMHPGCVDQTVGHGPIRAALEAAFTSPAHTSEARDSEVKAMDVLSLAELVDAAVCLESCEAAWCGDEMELAAPRRRLAKAYSGLRKTLFIAQDALECALRNSKRGSRTNAACSTALEYLRRATKQSDDAAMRQEAE